MSSKITDETSVQALRADVAGAVLTPESEDFDEVRSVWNGMIDREPAVIVRCDGSDDVAATIAFAREQDLDLAVRAGGHSVAGLSVPEDGVMIDLSTMTGVDVDRTVRTARVEGGATLGDFDAATQEHGLATTMGIASPTGVAGLTLGRGIGHLARTFGLACDNLLAAVVVTADGNVVTASDEENADLFWALRGGGGNFGVVTELTFELHELGPEVLAGPIFHRIDDAADVLRGYRDLMADAPDKVGCIAGVLALPPEEFVPEELHGESALYLVAIYAGDPDDGEAALADLRELGDPIFDGVATIPYTALQSMFDEANPDGNRYYWRSQFVPELTDETIEALVDTLSEHPLPSPFSTVSLECLGGAVNRVAPDATAFPHREYDVNLGVWANWADPAEDDRCIAWARAFHDEMVPYAADKVYVNYLDADEDDRIRAAYGDNYERLARVKAEWDPENVFHMNRNVEPANPKPA